MKAFVQRGIDSILSDCYPTVNTIETKFHTTHRLRLQKDSSWSITGTRQVLINNYCFAEAKSFALFFIFYAVCTSVITRNVTFLKFELDLAMMAVVVLILHFTMFRPYFNFSFLPILENMVAKSRNEEQLALINELRAQVSDMQEKEACRTEQIRQEEKRLREQQEADMVKREKQAAVKLSQAKAIVEQRQKCRDSQFSVFALALIYHVINGEWLKTTPGSDKNSTELMNQLFGVDPKLLGKSIDIITGVKGAREKITDKKQTFRRGDFDEARSFFNALNFQDGVKKLDKLEVVIKEQTQD